MLDQAVPVEIDVDLAQPGRAHLDHVDGKRVEQAGAVWETRAMSYPRDAYCTSCHEQPNGGAPRWGTLRPADHPWHRGIWWSWKFIDGGCGWLGSRTTGAVPGRACRLMPKTTSLLASLC